MNSFVPVSEYRSTADSVPGGIELSIPSRRNYFAAAFLTAWLGMWFLGETNALRELISPTPSAHGNQGESAFLIFWLCGWTIGGIFAATTLLWSLCGRERVTIQNDSLSIRREAFGLGFGKTYQLSAVRDLRAVETALLGGGLFGSSRRDPFGFSGGPLAFDYGAKTVQFGAGVDIAEAKYLLSKIAAAKPTLSILSSRSV